MPAKNPIVMLTRRATFSASHRLHSDSLSQQENEELFGKCNRTNGHGHNYVLEVMVKGEVNPKTGIVINLVDLKQIIEEAVLDKVDHLHLNLDVPEFKTLNPTTENLSIVCWKWLEARLPKGMLYEVKLYETENNIAIYRGE
jgi:6-pyruvoyltetrahydropterin/6-carboxytetrahydropterin synthase